MPDIEKTTPDVAPETVVTPVDTTPVEVEPIEAASESEDATFTEWSGSIDSLDTHEWFTSLDEGIRGSLKTGLGTLTKGYQSDYTKKTQDIASTRKGLDVLSAQIEENEKRAMRIMYGDLDPLEAKNQEIASLQERHRTSIDGLMADYNTKLATETKTLNEALDASNSTRTDALAKIEAWESAQAAANEARVTAQAAEMFTKLETEAADIVADERAFTEFNNILVMRGGDYDSALKLTRALFPAPAAAPKAATAPPGIDLMDLGGGEEIGSTAEATTEDLQTILNRMRREAQADENRKINHLA